MKNDFFSIDDDEDFKNLSIAGTSIKKIIENYEFNINDFISYRPIKKKEIKKKNIMIYLGYFEKWDPQECFYYATENTGFKPSDERSEGLIQNIQKLMIKLFHFIFI